MSRPKPRRPAPDPPDDPLDLDLAGGELMARLSRLRATIERKRREGWSFTLARPPHDEKVTSLRHGPG